MLYSGFNISNIEYHYLYFLNLKIISCILFLGITREKNEYRNNFQIKKSVLGNGLKDVLLTHKFLNTLLEYGIYYENPTQAILGSIATCAFAIAILSSLLSRVQVNARLSFWTLCIFRKPVAS